jgi:Carbohydrate esterase, sialic acid-specific acetylesterase
MTAWRFLLPSYLPLALFAVIASAKTVTIFLVAGQSNMVGKAAVVHFEELNNTTPTASTYQHFQNRDVSWRVREDVMIQFNNLHGGLTVGYGLDETRFGVELQFGHTVGDALRDDVFLIKCARGSTSFFWQ